MHVPDEVMAEGIVVPLIVFNNGAEVLLPS
jgi:hypothetical protein